MGKEDLIWSHRGIPLQHLPSVADDQDAWRFQPEQLLQQPRKDKQAENAHKSISIAGT